MSTVHDLWSKVETAHRLGFRNIFDVVAYRLLIKLGIHPVQKINRTACSGPFFKQVRKPSSKANSINSESAEFLYFGWYPQPLGGHPPNWHKNPFNGQTFQATEVPWWKLSDFKSGIGDIKTVWEGSRFDWALSFAQLASQGDLKSLDQLNTWLDNWCEKNPPYFGLNWKCGQEASIRVIHLAIVAMVLEQDKSPLPNLIELIKTYLLRIAPTIRYAIAQDNNHGTSEAAALFVGGTWLANFGVAEAKEWAVTGRIWLEDRALRLIGPQGSFSQSSLNYHRLLLDTFCVVEVWRQRNSLPTFSTPVYQRLKAAARCSSRVNPQRGCLPAASITTPTTMITARTTSEATGAELTTTSTTSTTHIFLFFFFFSCCRVNNWLIIIIIMGNWL